MEEIVINSICSLGNEIVADSGKFLILQKCLNFRIFNLKNKILKLKFITKEVWEQKAANYFLTSVD